MKHIVVSWIITCIFGAASIACAQQGKQFGQVKQKAPAIVSAKPFVKQGEQHMTRQVTQTIVLDETYSLDEINAGIEKVNTMLSQLEAQKAELQSMKANAEQMGLKTLEEIELERQAANKAAEEAYLAKKVNEQEKLDAEQAQ